jgi:hypothetical protein
MSICGLLFLWHYMSTCGLLLLFQWDDISTCELLLLFQWDDMSTFGLFNNNSSQVDMSSH